MPIVRSTSSATLIARASESEDDGEEFDEDYLEEGEENLFPSLPFSFFLPYFCDEV